MLHSHVEINPNLCHGKPVIRDSSVLVATLLGALAGPDSIETLLEDYPTIASEDIAASLEFARNLSDYQVTHYDAVA